MYHKISRDTNFGLFIRPDDSDQDLFWGSDSDTEYRSGQYWPGSQTPWRPATRLCRGRWQMSVFSMNNWIPYANVTKISNIKVFFINWIHRAFSLSLVLSLSLSLSLSIFSSLFFGSQLWTSEVRKGSQILIASCWIKDFHIQSGSSWSRVIPTVITGAVLGPREWPQGTHSVENIDTGHPI